MKVIIKRGCVGDKGATLKASETPIEVTANVAATLIGAGQAVAFEESDAEPTLRMTPEAAPPEDKPEPTTPARKKAKK